MKPLSSQTKRKDRKKPFWTRVGAAWPHDGQDVDHRRPPSFTPLSLRCTGQTLPAIHERAPCVGAGLFIIRQVVPGCSDVVARDERGCSPRMSRSVSDCIGVGIDVAGRPPQSTHRLLFCRTAPGVFDTDAAHRRHRRARRDQRSRRPEHSRASVGNSGAPASGVSHALVHQPRVDIANDL